jgi:hypothetical protein
VTYERIGKELQIHLKRSNNACKETYYGIEFADLQVIYNLLHMRPLHTDRQDLFCLLVSKFTTDFTPSFRGIQPPAYM